MTNRSADFVGEIGLLAYPDCQVSAIHGLTDLFRIANEWAGGKDHGPIRTTHWMRPEDETLAPPACSWDSHPGSRHNLDYIIVPPSIVMPERMSDTAAEADWLKASHGNGSRVCSVCAGAFVLAGSGLIDGRRVTTHWAFARQFSERYPQVEVADDHMVLDDGDIITAGGILAWTDLGLTLVERLMGPSIMLATARFLLTEPPKRLQRPYAMFVPRFDHGDPAILRVQHHVHAEPAAPHSLAGLAGLAGLGERTFLRRFSAATRMRPTEYVQNVRISKAREGLELTRRSVDEIAWTVGYEDPAAFRKVFKKLTGLRPNDYRARFSAVG